jgi:hypothetical protein
MQHTTRRHAAHIVQTRARQQHGARARNGVQRLKAVKASVGHLEMRQALGKFFVDRRLRSFELCRNNSCMSMIMITGITSTIHYG